MKFTASLAVLAVIASSAMAVAPTPIAGCTKTVVVQPTDTGCLQFATANGCTTDQLLAWNTKLRTDCANLDVGVALCVSITKGAASTSAGSSSAAPSASVTAAPSSSAAASTTKAPVASSSSSSAASAPTNAKPTSGSASNKASFGVAAAGLLLSAAYLL